jgi:hypothetical protein
MTLTTKIYCSRQYILKKYYYSVVKKYGSALGGVRTPWTPPLSTPLRCGGIIWIKRLS